MPVDWSKYPENWKYIALAVKTAAHWQCQVCGKQCYRPGERALNRQDVLTVAHINHVVSDCRLENLVAACSVCHLKYDAERRRWERLALKRIQWGQNVLSTSLDAETRIASEVVEAVEQECGIGSAGWDTIDPHAIVAAVLTVAPRVAFEWKHIDDTVSWPVGARV